MDPSQLADSTRNAYETLLKPVFFALGPVGSGGDTSQGEIALDHLLIDPRGAELFKLILEHGSREGKLYALVGLRVLDRSAYLQAVSRFRDDQTPVVTMSGGMRGPFPMADVIRQLEGW